MGKKSRFTLWILLPVSAVLLSACEGSPFTDEDFVKKIFPTGYWDFLIQLVAFIVLLIVVFLVGYKPVKKMLKKRQDAVDKMISETEENNRVAKRAAMASDQTIQEGKEEAERIIASAKKTAELERAKILSAAEQEASAKRKKADEDIAAAKEASKEEVRKEIVDVAMLASETLLGREVTTDDNKRLVADFVDGLREGNDGDRK